MNIYHHIDEFVQVPNPVVTVGTFDGVHLGHQAIFRRMLEEASNINGETVVITFHPHPRIVLQIESSNLKFINTQEVKIKRLANAGIHNLIIIPFTREFSRTTSEAFVKDYIVDKIKPARLVIGYDHHFGKNRMGDFRKLYDMGHRYGFKVDRIPAQDVENIAISSTKIRKALESGDVQKANRLLGYQYSITGTVVHGNELGRTIGFPTANILVDDQYKLITATGVYACLVEWNGKLLPGMSNIGYRPTINEGKLTIEAHIFDFDEVIYDQTISICFIKRIRDEQRFDTIHDLRDQLQRDQVKCLEILNLPSE
ncbi:MAG: bifunctional riboflavin kinase/FAD synthetase [Bacteroidales bacterium]|nr:bifunctional riboflavin kinase/FAD synthetase [Bacteroidales bacterium]